MLKIRLTRVGMKKQPSYRVVVADAEAKRDGRVVERIGHYNPLTDPAEYRIDEDRALYWLSVGAQPTDAVRQLLEKQGTFGRLERLRKGEDREALMNEYLAGAAAEPSPVARAVKPVAEAAGDVVETVVETVTEAATKVAAAVEAVVSEEEE